MNITLYTLNHVYRGVVEHSHAAVREYHRGWPIGEDIAMTGEVRRPWLDYYDRIERITVRALLRKTTSLLKAGKIGEREEVETTMSPSGEVKIRVFYDRTSSWREYNMGDVEPLALFRMLTKK